MRKECTLTDDKLVDEAAEQNAVLVAKQLDAAEIRRQVVASYKRVAGLISAATAGES